MRSTRASTSPAQAADARPAAGPEQPRALEAAATALSEASADEGDAESMSLPAGAAPPPLYATQLPAPALLLYRLQRGALSGHARLNWQQDGQRYALQFDAQAHLNAGAARRAPPLIEQRSSGQLDVNGLAPDRYTDRRRHRAMQAANFQRDAGRISFSGPSVEYPAWAGAQDRLGTLVQLAAIYNAAAHPPAEVTLFVVGARGGAGLWTFKLLGTEQLVTPLGEVSTLYLRREPERREDLRVEVWLDPARSHWPVRILSTPMRGGDPLELTLSAEPARP